MGGGLGTTPTGGLETAPAQNSVTVRDLLIEERAPGIELIELKTNTREDKIQEKKENTNTLQFPDPDYTETSESGNCGSLDSVKLNKRGQPVEERPEEFTQLCERAKSSFPQGSFALDLLKSWYRADVRRDWAKFPKCAWTIALRKLETVPAEKRFLAYYRGIVKGLAATVKDEPPIVYHRCPPERRDVVFYGPQQEFKIHERTRKELCIDWDAQMARFAVDQEANS